MTTRAGETVRLATALAWFGLGGVAASGCAVPDDDGDTGGDPSAYCASVATWPDEATSEEGEVLDLVNAARATGGTCGGQSYAPSPPLAVSTELRCAARVHTQDMAARGYFDHDNPEGESPFDRMERAGYVYAAAGENIAQGYPTPAAVVQGWLESPGHCANIRSPDFAETGLGFVRDGLLWTQTFGRALR